MVLLSKNTFLEARELNNFVDNVATWLPIRINVIQGYFLKSSLRNILVELHQNFTTKKNSFISKNIFG